MDSIVVWLTIIAALTTITGLNLRDILSFGPKRMPSASADNHRRSRVVPLISTALLVVVIGAFLYTRGVLNFGPIFARSSATGQALVPVGPLIYSTNAPGSCDKHGAQWWQNTSVSTHTVQQCVDGGLVLSAPNADGPLGVVGLQALPDNGSFPSNYVAEVTVKPISSFATAKMGFKFRQQSAGDDGQYRGGYSLLVDPSGHVQYNWYEQDGTRHKKEISGLHPTPNGQSYILDLVVKGTTYSFYLEGMLLDTETDARYSNGFFCLAIEPGATVEFSHLALYQVPA
jgi:hypothetical protein